MGRLGVGRSSIYEQLKRRLLTQPVRLGVRAKGWPDHEVNALTRARLAGKNDDELREIVAALERARNEDGRDIINFIALQRATDRYASDMTDPAVDDEEGTK